MEGGRSSADKGSKGCPACPGRPNRTRRGPAARPPGEPMAMRRSTQMLLIGLAVFVIGFGVVVISLTGSGKSPSSKPAATTSTTIQAGTVVVPAAAATAPATFTIPDGKQAVAVQLPFVGGLAGYARAGDTVNVYGNAAAGPLGDVPQPATRMLLSGVQVLAVSGPAPGADAG